MKRYRPHCSGYIVLYVLALLCLSDTVYTLYVQISGTGNEYMSTFSAFSYIILAMALAYVYMYIRAQVAFDEKRVRVAWPAYIRAKQGEKRPLFIYRQGDLDIRFIDKTIPLARIVKYGYVEDLGYTPIDQSNPQGKVKLFPVHEVAIITDDNKRYHMNAAIYSPKQLKAIVAQLRDATGIAPEGALKDIL